MLVNKYYIYLFSPFLFFRPHFPAMLPIGLMNHFLPSPWHYSSGRALLPEQSASILAHSKADCLVSEQFSFYDVRFLASSPTPNIEDQGIPLRLAPTS
jgi:hypothetical protein